jgi:predicted dehydrogenase
MTILRTGLIGAGGIGRHLANAMRPVEELELVGLADVESGVAADAAQQLETQSYPSWQALLDDTRLDAVVLATPPFAHMEQALAAFQAGKHVYMEKPMALNVADCDTILAAAKSAGKSLMVGQVLRLFPLFWKSKEILNTGILGQVRAISVRRMGESIQLFSSGWRAKRELGGGLILETNVHELDYARWIGGEVQQVSAVGGHREGLGDYEAFWQGLLWFESGATGAVESSLIDTMGEYSVRIQCENGTLVHGGFGGELRYKTLDGQSETITRDQIETPDPYTWELRAFARHVLHGESMPFDGWDGRQVVAIGCACIQSMENGTIETVRGI